MQAAFLAVKGLRASASVFEAGGRFDVLRVALVLVLLLVKMQC